MEIATAIRSYDLAHDDWEGLRSLPWGVPLEEWNDPVHQVDIIDQRRGLSRHPVIFVRVNGRKYAIKETSPEAASEEIANYREIIRRGCPALVPVGHLVVIGEPLAAGSIAGYTQYISGDMGYCITRLATRVLPQSLLYQYPFTEENKRKLLVAIARLLVTLHNSGIFWGDPSLANVLVDLSRRRLLAVLADAETVQIHDDPLSPAIRQHDVDFFIEAMRWQSEDIRLARELPEEETVITEDDTIFFQETYDALLRIGSRPTHDIEEALNRLGSGMVGLGSGMLGLGALAWRASVTSLEMTRRPGWYREQLRDLMGIWIPRRYARRLYDLVLGHKWLMSEEAGYDVGLGDAAADFRERYHDPLVELLRAYAPDRPIDYADYLRILQHIWTLSQREGRPIPIEEGAIDYLLPRDG